MNPFEYFLLLIVFGTLVSGIVYLLKSKNKKDCIPNCPKYSCSNNDGCGGTCWKPKEDDPTYTDGQWCSDTYDLNNCWRYECCAWNPTLGSGLPKCDYP